MNKDWDNILNPIKESSMMIQLKQFITERRKETNVFPEPQYMFNAFNLCPYDKLKVVIIGQDPYPQKGCAHGLAFSTLQTSTPFSLQKIFEEIHDNLYPYVNKNEHKYLFPSNNLTSWAQQGVLLLNRILSVEENSPGKHKNRGWEYFTDSVVKKLNEYDKPLVFMLWGNDAKELKPFITDTKHLILEAAHPASEAHKGKGFLGCKHFFKAHEFLKDKRNDLEENFIDLNPFINLENAIGECKKIIKSNRYPFPEHIDRIENLKKTFIEQFNLRLTTPIKFTT